MRQTSWLARGLIVGVLVLAGQAAHASLVCSGCEYGDAGTYLGAFDPQQSDFGTFQHTDVGQDAGPGAAFEDFWVFDLGAAGAGSISADFTMLTGIAGFTGELYADAGSVCTGDACSSVMLGALLASGADSQRRWEIMVNSLAAGRYVIRVAGTTNVNSTSAYTGQLGFANTVRTVPVVEPGTAGLLGMGLFGVGLWSRRRRP